MDEQHASVSEKTSKQHPPGPGRGGWRWWASLTMLQVISLLPAVWGVWCTVIFLFLFPITDDTRINTALMLVVLLSFIASAVRRDPNDPAKKVFGPLFPIT
jgi:hypothetical protein